MDRVKEAVELFNNGYNCSQAVFSTYCDKLKIDKEVALKTALGFGAGMGRLQEVCGAVTGVFMVLSLLYGSDKPNDATAREKVYNSINEFKKAF